MILVHNKDFENLSNVTEKELNKVGFDTSDGSVSKLFSDIINKNISDFYDTLNVFHSQSFLTTSSDEYVDKIGALLNCKRLNDEDDNNYKNRIANQVLNLSMANETSLRISILNIENVKDVLIKKNTFGPGSFTVIPISTGRENNLYEVQKVVESVSSFGERVDVRLPFVKEISIDLNLVFKTSFNDSEKQVVLVAVKGEISKYINSLKIGEDFIINKFTERILSISDNIIDYSCNDFRINNDRCAFINQASAWDEVFKVSEDTKSIIIN